MNKFETMRRVVCGLCIWNLILTAGLFIGVGQKIKADLDIKICNQEMIPLEVIEEEF